MSVAILRAWPSKVREIACGNSVSLVAASRLLSILFTLLTAPIIARTIGPVGRGETATALAAFSVVPIVVALGLPIEIRRVTAKENVRSAIRSVRDLCLVMFIPTTAIGAALYFTIFASMDAISAVTASVGVALAPISVSWLCDQSVMIARANYRVVALLQLAQPVTYVAIIAVGFVLGVLSVPYILIANVVGSFATFMLGLFVCRASFLGSRYPRRVLARGGLKFAGSAVAETATNRLDQLLVLPLIGGFATGLYSVAVTMSSIPLSVGHALGAHFFNIAARETSRNVNLAGLAIRYGFIASAACAIPICLLSPVLVPLVFGEEFRPAVPLVLIGQAGSIAMTASYVGSMVLAGRGQGRLMLVSQLSSLVVGTSLLLILSPYWSALGASISAGARYLVLLVMVVICLRVGVKNLLPKTSDFRSLLKVLK